MYDFPDYNTENFGGLASFNFIQQYAVQSLVNNDNKITVAPVLKSGYNWLKGISLLKSLQFKETPALNSPGNLYTYEVSGIYPGQSSSIISLFDDMKEQPLIIDVLDNNNQRRILGDMNNPVSFKFGYDSKNQPSSRPENAFTFSWTSPKPAPFYISD